MKFVITQDALTPVAEALSGRSRLAGVAAGLKNQMLGMELDKMRDERQRVQDMHTARQNMALGTAQQALPGFSREQLGQLMHERLGFPKPDLDFEYDEHGNARYDDNGAPVFKQVPVLSPEQMQEVEKAWPGLAASLAPAAFHNAYGGDAVDMQRMTGMAQKQAYEADLQNRVAAALAQGNQVAVNQTVAALGGKEYNPYTGAPGGYVLNKTTGATIETPLSQSNVAKNNAQAAYDYSGVGLREAQTGTEFYKRENLAADTQKTLAGIAAEEAKAQQERVKALAYVPLDKPTVEQQFSYLDPNGGGLGKPGYVVDEHRLQRFQKFMTRNGINNAPLALPMFLEEEQEANRLGERKVSDAIIESAIQSGRGARPAPAADYNAVVGGMARRMSGSVAGAAQAEVTRRFGSKITPQNQMQVKAYLEQQMAAGKINAAEAAQIWNAHSQ